MQSGRPTTGFVGNRAKYEDLFPNTPTSSDDSCAVDYTQSSMCAADGSFDERVLCQKTVLDAQSYSSFAGIMLGMLTFGILSDVIGRNAAGILTSILMIVGVTTMTFVKAEQLETMFLIWAIFFGIFGKSVKVELTQLSISLSNLSDSIFTMKRTGSRWRIPLKRQWCCRSSLSSHRRSQAR